MEGKADAVAVAIESPTRTVMWAGHAIADNGASACANRRAR